MNGIVRSSSSMLRSFYIVECKTISSFLMIELIYMYLVIKMMSQLPRHSPNVLSCCFKHKRY